ncbi:MAG: hypothetical protein JST09_13670 [Bacteroidetes bacterium]|nr:hypothetical protein [Bacteroidota bacterium]MBS1609017.1 hypothetical protein [Bacteroidota bacterium]
MRFFVATILTIAFSFFAGLIMPWWSIALVAFVVALVIRQSPLKSLLSGFFALFILWGLLAWWIDLKNQGILSKKIAMVLPLGGNAILLIVITAIIGAIVAGLAALTASCFHLTRK